MDLRGRAQKGGRWYHTNDEEEDSGEDRGGEYLDWPLAGKGSGTISAYSTGDGKYLIEGAEGN